MGTEQPVRFARAARPHRTGQKHVLHVMNAVELTIGQSSGGEELRVWVGRDDRGVELEIAAVVWPDGLLALHVTPPASLRNR